MNPITQFLNPAALELAWSELNSTASTGWDGFIWMSDAQSPILIDGGGLPAWKQLHLDPTSFIHEAWLWRAESRDSVHIRQTNDTFLFRQVCLPEAPEGSFFSHLARALPGISRLNFYQHWQETADSFEPDFKALVPGWTALVGLERS